MNVFNEVDSSSAPIPAQNGNISDKTIADNNTSNEMAGDLKKFSGELQGSSKLSDSFLKNPLSANDKLAGTTEKPSTAKPAKHNPSAEKSSDPKKRRARKKWKKPKDKPNRPLSAYNLFFQAERASMLGGDAKMVELEKNKKRVHRKTHGKIGFAEMARSIGQRWKELPEETKKPFLERAAKEKARYVRELVAWKDEQDAKPQSGKSLVAALKAEKLAAERDGVSSVLASSSSIEKADEAMKLKMMANEIQQQNMVLMQQRSEAEYLRALQERALLARRSMLDSSLFHYGPNASEASANALMQFQNGISGVGPLSGMGSMGMNLNMNSLGMNMNSIGMNAFGSMNMMAAADLQRRQAQLGAANRLQQLRASAGLGANVGDHVFMGMRTNTAPSGMGNGQLEMGQSQYPQGDTSTAMARHLQNRFNL